VRYFLRLGTLGFGGPIAVVGYMQRDLVEARGWISKQDFLDGVALGQTMPGPLAAQVAMWAGYLKRGAPGAAATALAFIAPSFLMVSAVAAVYAHYSGLAIVASLFYGIAPAVMAIITIAAYKLVRLTDGKDWRAWTISAVVFTVTATTGREPIYLIVGAGLLLILLDARPAWPPRRSGAGGTPGNRRFPGVPPLSLPVLGTLASGGVLVSVGLFFLKTGALVFGSGLAIVPLLRDGRRHPAPLAHPGPVPRRRRDGPDHPRAGRHHRRVHRLPRGRARRGAHRHHRHLHPHLPRRGRSRPLVHPPPRQHPDQGVRHRRHRGSGAEPCAGRWSCSPVRPSPTWPPSPSP